MSIATYQVPREVIPDDLFIAHVAGECHRHRRRGRARKAIALMLETASGEQGLARHRLIEIATSISVETKNVPFLWRACRWFGIRN